MTREQRSDLPEEMTAWKVDYMEPYLAELPPLLKLRPSLDPPPNLPVPWDTASVLSQEDGWLCLPKASGHVGNSLRGVGGQSRRVHQRTPAEAAAK